MPSSIPTQPSVEATYLPPADLLRRCAHGSEPRVWRQFVGRYEEVLQAGVHHGFRLTGRLSPQAADREDMLQEVYCRLLAAGRKRLRNCRAEGNNAVSAFLYRMAVRVVLDHYRMGVAVRRGGRTKTRPEAWRGELDYHLEPATEDQEGHLLRRHALRTALRRYSGSRQHRRRDVQIWLLTTLAGFRQDEIPRILPGGVTTRMVGKAVGRVRGHLRAVGGELGALL